MVFSRSMFFKAVVVGLVSLFVFSDNAFARRRGFVIINYGDEIYELGELPDELRGDPEVNDWKLGYMCSHFGILWSDLFCWDKKIVAFSEDAYSDLPEDIRLDLEAQYSFSDAKRGLWQRYGAWVLVIGFVGLIAYGKATGD